MAPGFLPAQGGSPPLPTGQAATLLSVPQGATATQEAAAPVAPVPPVAGVRPPGPPDRPQPRYTGAPSAPPTPVGSPGWPAADLPARPPAFGGAPWPQPGPAVWPRPAPGPVVPGNPYPPVTHTGRNLAAAVPGVSVPTLTPVMSPPAGPPHPLPAMPVAAMPAPPVPQGFPGPFAHALPQGPLPACQALPPGAMPNPLLMQMMGGGGVPVPQVPPMAGGAAPAAAPVPAGPAAPQPPGWGAGMAGPLPAGPPAALPAPLQHLIAAASPLIQHPRVREALGPGLPALMARPDLYQFLIGLGAGILATAEGQAVLREAGAGRRSEEQVATWFAGRLRTLLEMHGLLPAAGPG